MCRPASACHGDQWHGEVHCVGTPLRLLQGHAARGCGSEDGKQKSRAHETSAEKHARKAGACAATASVGVYRGKFEATGEAQNGHTAKFPVLLLPQTTWLGTPNARCKFHANSARDAIQLANAARPGLVAARRQLYLPDGQADEVGSRPGESKRGYQGHLRATANVCVPRHAQAVLQFSAFDVDDDGVVSYEDFATAMTRHNPALAHPSKKCGRRACRKSPQGHCKSTAHLGPPYLDLQAPARPDVQGGRHRWQRVRA